MLETDQGLAFTRMVVVDNMEEVRSLSRQIVMEGGNGNMIRNVQRFSPDIEERALKIIEAIVPLVDTDKVFGQKSGDVGELHLAAGVFQGQLGTPSHVVRYGLLVADDDGRGLTGTDTYVLTVPAGIVQENGYYSITVYGVDDRLLIPNELGRYDRTTYTSEPNPDGTYTVVLSPDGSGKNGIPTGKPFYAILRSYLPVPGADMTVRAERR